MRERTDEKMRKGAREEEKEASDKGREGEEKRVM